MIQATGVILSGGRSVRMGTDKAFLKIGRQSMIERVAGELLKVFPEVLVSGGGPEIGRELGLRVVPDIFDGKVPLCGVHAALCAASHAEILAVACDMPFINAELAGFIARQLEGYDVAVPSYGSYLQPLFAAYSRGCLPVIEEFLRASSYKTDKFYSRVKVNYVNIEGIYPDMDIETMFFNVNTLKDLNKAREMTDKNVGKSYRRRA